MGQQVDADAKRLYFAHSFKQLHLDAGGMQAQGCCQAADAAADHCHAHLCLPDIYVCFTYNVGRKRRMCQGVEPGVGIGCKRTKP